VVIKLPNDETQKVTITLPKRVLQRMDALVPARQRSRFIAEVLSERLALEEQLLALDESAGAWSDEKYPDMQGDEGVERWLAELRSSWNLSVELDDGDLSA
jgi:hypothetical protein